MHAIIYLILGFLLHIFGEFIINFLVFQAFLVIVEEIITIDNDDGNPIQ